MKDSGGGGASGVDNFGRVAAGMMGGEDGGAGGFRIWTDMHYIEVLDPEPFAPVKEGEVGTLVVTPLWTNNATPFLRGSAGDLVLYSEADDASGPYSVFPNIRHPPPTTAVLHVSGVTVHHPARHDLVVPYPHLHHCHV